MRIPLMSVLICLPILSHAQTLVDPTRPPGKSGAAVMTGTALQTGTENTAQAFPKVTVSAIFLSENGSYAILDGEIVHEGEMWKAFRLAEIKANAVVLARDSRHKEYVLNNYNKVKIEANNEF